MTSQRPVTMSYFQSIMGYSRARWPAGLGYLDSQVLILPFEVPPLGRNLLVCTVQPYIFTMCMHIHAPPYVFSCVTSEAVAS